MISKHELDMMQTLIQQYGNTWQAYYAAAECMFIEEHKRLPEWACFIVDFTYIPKTDAFVFVHRDPEAAL